MAKTKGRGRGWFGEPKRHAAARRKTAMTKMKKKLGRGFKIHNIKISRRDRSWDESAMFR